MELGEITICLENIEQVEGKLDGLFVVISQSSRDCAKKSLVLQHYLHIFI